MLEAHRIIKTGLCYVAKTVTAETKTQLVGFIHTLIQHMNPFANSNDCDISYIFKPSRFWGGEFSQLLINCDIGTTLNINATLDQTSLSDIILGADNIYLEYIQRH